MRPHCQIAGPDPHCTVCGVAAASIRSRRHCPARPPGPCGVGCHLARLLSWFARKDSDCGCEAYAAHMDAWGPDGCEERLDEIVGHLLEQAEKRSVLLGAVPAAAVVPVVRLAISRARAETTPPQG